MQFLENDNYNYKIKNYNSLILKKTVSFLEDIKGYTMLKYDDDEKV